MKTPKDYGKLVYWAERDIRGWQVCKGYLLAEYKSLCNKRIGKIKGSMGGIMMTDEQVKKGLECCVVESACNYCPYVKDRDCREHLFADSLALINRLEEEKEQISKETAKEILVSIKEHIFNVTAENDNFIKLLKKEYGVEIEE